MLLRAAQEDAVYIGEPREYIFEGALLCSRSQRHIRKSHALRSGDMRRKCGCSENCARPLPSDKARSLYS